MFPRPLLPPWHLLIDRLDDSGVTARWACSEPALSGLVTAAQLAHWTGKKHPHRAEVFNAVLNLASADGGSDGDAVLVALHLLRNGAGALAARLSDLSTTVDDLILGELTVQILSTTPRALPTYAAHLLRRTRSIVLAELLCETPLTPDRISAAETRSPSVDPAVIHPADEPVLMLADLFDWAQREQIASAADLALLLELERARDFGRGARHRLARTHGVHERTIRRRRDGTLAALRSARGRYLKASA